MAAQFPLACTALRTKAAQLNDQISVLEDQLKDALKQEKQKIQNQINALKPQLKKAQDNLSACILANTNPVFGPQPIPTRPVISTDTAPVTKTKVISLPFMQKKFDDFFNKRTDPPLFKLRLHHQDHIDNGQVDNDPPDSTFEFGFIDGEKLLQDPNNGYRRIAFTNLGQLDHDYYFNDINSKMFNVNIDSTNPAPVELKITFETDGPDEMPSSGALHPDMKFKEFHISVRFTLGFDAAAKRVDFLSYINDLSKITFKNTANLAIQINGTYLGKAINTTIPAVNFDSFYDETFVQPVVTVHIVTTDAIDPGGATQKSMRKQIFNKFSEKDKTTGLTPRDNINTQVNQWLLGETGNFPIGLFRNDGTQLTITYTVPKNQLNPFPFVPSNWPSAHNPNSNPALDFSPGPLANIDHIVVLTKENRSFDHMLGYLSLPPNKGGMGRSDVDGLKGSEFNPYDGVNYPSFPFAPGQTLFAPNAAQSAGQSFHQVDGGKMDGFVRSYAEDSSDPANGLETGNGSSIMGYHTGINLPVYDALARDFAVCDRWFAPHPGPTFPNRFYELTGRLNIMNGLQKPENDGLWEIDNTTPLTPVFTKTIFDHLNDYMHIGNVSWNYFENFYCFLRFFENYTFDHTNVVDMDDPVNGFFVKARTGTLPSVSYIDPHFIDLPPHGNCDEPPSDVKDGQAIVQRIVEAVVASPKWNKTLLIILYDEHGGFYDHVPPPPLQNFPDDPTNYNLPVKTYGLRTPAFFISPWVGAGQVIGHASGKTPGTVFFDSNSILKTIAKRFMSDFPPYMGPHYAVAQDLSVVIGNTIRQSQFLPFIRYNLMYGSSQKMLDVQNASAVQGTKLWQWDKNGSIAQDFSFEDAGNGFVYIRSHCGNYYVTVDVPPPVIVGGQPSTAPPAQNFNIKLDVKYKEGVVISPANKFNPACQKWKLTTAGISILQRDLFVITSAFLSGKVLKNLDNQTGGAVVLGDADPLGHLQTSPNVWTVTSPLISHEIVVK